MIFILLLVPILLLAIFVNVKMDRPTISTVAGAPIMAMGIMLKGIFTELESPFIHAFLFYAIICAAYWVIIHYMLDLLQGVFFSSHIKDPLASFSIGTWIAATSIIIIILSDKQFQLISHILLFLNLLFWFLYIVLLVRNYLVIFRKFPSYIHNIHGGLLLSCVATQSIVISGYHSFGRSFPPLFASILLIIGLIFYLLNLGLIVLHYSLRKNGDFTESWKNTNCIIHGALSITGVSLTISHLEAAMIIEFIWLTAFTLFLTVETIEVIRAVQRIKLYGWTKGIWIYSPTQWARIFTFGMLLFFTEKLPLNNWVPIEILRHLVLTYLPIVIVVHILIEIYLLSMHTYKNMKQKQTHQQQQQLPF